MTKRPFSTNGNRYKSISKLIHTDVCGPLNIALDGIWSISLLSLMITQGMVMFYLLHRKSEAFEKFKELWIEMKKQLDKNIKLL